VLLEQWRIALLDDDGVDLDGMGVMCSMVYWADFLYDKPASLRGRPRGQRDGAGAECGC
jgi:hypothetical protein